MASIAGYVTFQEVADRLGWMNQKAIFVPTTTSIPKIATIEDIISGHEEEVEKKTRRNWRTAYKTSSNEFHSYNFRNYRLMNIRSNGQNMMEIESDFNNWKPVLVSGTDKIEVWDGSDWIDFVATKTVGSARGDEDYWVDSDNGRVYIHNSFPITGEKNIKLTYRYGEYVSSPTTDIPRDLKRAIVDLAAADLQESHGSHFQYQIEDSRGGLRSDKLRSVAKAAIKEHTHLKPINQYN